VKIERYERWFLIAVAAALLLAVVALLATIAGEHAAFPESSERIDPALISTTAPFDEPGVHPRGDGDYDVIMIARTWAFEPAEMELPLGATAHFRIASVDVVHGFNIPHTNANAMIIPGQVTELEVTFDEPGPHSVICHEYCGIQHHIMGGVINVVGGAE
jgi:cytochrome c oxidase subunit II